MKGKIRKYSLLLLFTVLTQIGAASDSYAQTGSGSSCAECLKRSTRLFAEGKNQEALKTLKDNEAGCRDSSQFYLLLSTILIRMKNHEGEAAEAASNAVRLSPKSIAANMQYAVCLSAMDDKEKALPAFQKLIKLDPSNYEAWSALGALYSSAGDEEQSRRCANKAACLEPSSRAARLRTAQNLFKSGKFTALAAELKHLLNDDDLEPEFFIPLSKDALSMTAYQECVQAADRALSAYPDCLEVIKTKAVAQLWLRQYEEALNTISKAETPASSKKKAKNKIQMDDPELIGVKALILMRLGRNTEARSLLAKLPDKKEPTAIYSLARGLSLQEEGDSAAAMKEFWLALKNDQLFAPAHIELARSYIRLGSEEEAIAEAREIQRTRYFLSSGKALEARVYLEQAPLREKMEEALRLAKEANKANPDDPEALIGLALCELRAGHLDPARTAINRALEIEPGNIDGILAQAKLFESEGASDKRLETLKKARGMAGSDSEVLVALSQAYVDSGNDEAAVELLSKALSEGAGVSRKPDALVSYALARAYQHNGQASEAAKYYKECLSLGLKGQRAALAREALKQFGRSL